MSETTLKREPYQSHLAIDDVGVGYVCDANAVRKVIRQAIAVENQPKYWLTASGSSFPYSSWNSSISLCSKHHLQSYTVTFTLAKDLQFFQVRYSFGLLSMSFVGVMLSNSCCDLAGVVPSFHGLLRNEIFALR